ncbi:MAG: glycosyltransferase family 39 protein [Candidatus Binatia bacterium]
MHRSVGTVEPPRSIYNQNVHSSDPAQYWDLGLLLFCVWVLFTNLGGAALFEPDEGRNAEIAREILLLKDWVTPHYDFIPRLDKPIFFFGLVALSYKFFGISEWAARLPSALAALACLCITYRFAGSLFGRRAGLWSALILLSSIEFFALSRAVIMDMTLTFCITFALWSFCLGQRGVESGAGKSQFLLMYVAMGMATLLKGPIGFLLPAAVIGVYLLLTKRWSLLRHMQVPLGIALLILTAAPWYLTAESRNPGYLRYFLWEENVHRFTTMQFKRSGPWYYFIGVLAGGFFPWTVLLPATITDLGKRALKGEHLFLSLWVAIPLLFFSLSSSKLPHYILPIYPPLAIILAAVIAKAQTDSTVKKKRILWFPLATFCLVSFAITLTVLWPDFLPDRFQAYIHEHFSRRPAFSGIIGLQLIPVLELLITDEGWAKQQFLYPATAIGFALLVLCSNPIWIAVSLDRSSIQLVERVAPLIHADDQLVLYGGYPSSLPFYLNIQRPIWVIAPADSSKILGSDYVARQRPEPAAGYGKVLYTYQEFAALWKDSKHRLVVFIKSSAVDRLGGSTPSTIARVGDISVVTNK